jgi:hypothetical protein
MKVSHWMKKQKLHYLGTINFRRTDYWADDTLGNYKFTIEDIETVIEIKS